MKIFNQQKSQLSFGGFLSVATLAMLSACSSNPTTNKYSDTAVPADEIQTIQARIDADRATHTDVLAPKSFGKAEKKLNDAKKESAHQANARDIFSPLAESRAWLDQAEKNADRARMSAPEIVKVRDEAKAAGAPTLATKYWNEAESRFKDEMEDQESNPNRTISENDRKEIEGEYIAAQTLALKNKYLAKSREVVMELNKQNAQKLIPAAYDEAKNKLIAAESTIGANRNDVDTIQTASYSAELAAMKAKDLFIRAKGIKNGSPEQAALAMASQDQKNSELTSNLDRTAETLNTTQKDLSTTQGALSNSQEDLSSTKKDLSKSESERKMFKSQAEMEQFIASIQNRFNSSQAEVYQQGNNLLIRVKGMGFKSGDSKIPETSNALLGQLESVIQEFPGKNVMVEGHTDSMGGSLKNQQLSENRAQAVKQYLVANNTITENRISSKGYGAQKPIASNKAAAGRMENRRVDVVIENVADFRQGSEPSQTN